LKNNNKELNRLIRIVKYNLKKMIKIKYPSICAVALSMVFFTACLKNELQDTIVKQSCSALLLALIKEG